jgi:hypothetical protein
MIRAVVYDGATGKVVKILTVPDIDCLSENINDGQEYIVSDWSGDIALASVVDGVITVQDRVGEDEIILRGMRDALLSASDWTQSPDSPLSDAAKTAWANYRQALRDLPANTSDPANPIWPSKPS